MALAPSAFENELKVALASPVEAGLIEIVPDSAAVAARLASAFPLYGSKIDWRAVSGHLGAGAQSQRNDFDAFSKFFNSRSKELGRESVAYYLNDSQVSYSLRASLWTLSRHLAPIIEVPGHHYFIAHDMSWCMALTMEGDMDFGYAPKDRGR